MLGQHVFRHQEVTDEVQKPCSEILVNLCRSVKSGPGGARMSHLEKVMDVLMAKFDGGGGERGAGVGSSSTPAAAAGGTPLAGRKVSSMSTSSLNGTLGWTTFEV